MSFRHLDQYSRIPSPLTAVPPTGRLVGTALLAVGATVLPPGAWWQLAALEVIVVALALVGHIPIRILLLRLLGPLVFVAVAAVGVLVLVPGEPTARIGWLRVSDEGLRRFGAALGRGTVALSGAVVLVTTTSYPEFVDALRALRLPKAVTAALGLAYRLLYIFVDEIERLERAARSRNAGAGSVSRRRLLVGITAAVLARAFHRAERTHLAMLARGSDGTLPRLVAPSWTRASAVAFAAYVGGVVAVALLGYVPS